MAEHGNDSRVAVLVDCDNTAPEVIGFALQMVAQFGEWVSQERQARVDLSLP